MDEYWSIASEINELEKLLEMIPEQNAIERLAIESRIKRLTYILELNNDENNKN